MGRMNRSSSGKPCLHWINMSGYYTGNVDMFPDGSPEDAKNYCRNLGSHPPHPWCMTDVDELEQCDIPYARSVYRYEWMMLNMMNYMYC